MASIDEMKPERRTLLVAAVAIAYPFGQTGFELGAYGELLFEHKLASWITVTAMLLVFAVLPKHYLPVPRSHLWFFAIPSLWMLGRFAIGVWSPGALVNPVLFALGIGSFVLCVPYAIYLIVRIANPGLANLRGTGPRLSLMAIAIIFFAAGYGIGVRNGLFLTCQDLRVDGRALPEYCAHDASTSDARGGGGHSQ